MPTSSSLNAAVRRRRYEVYDYSDVMADKMSSSVIRVLGEKKMILEAAGTMQSICKTIIRINQA